MEELMKAIDKVGFTFSVNCRSGYLGNKCQCWRCRKERGEEATKETEEIAAEQARECDENSTSRRKMGR